MKIKRLIALLLVLIMSSFVIVGCGSGTSGGASKDTGAPAVGTQSNTQANTSSKSQSENFSATGYPIVKDRIPINIAVKKGATPSVRDDLEVTKNIEKLTNIDMVFNIIPDDSYTQKLNLFFASGSMPDIVASVPVDMMVNQGKIGQLLVLNDLIDKYAPNVKEIMNVNTFIKPSITAPDGNIYSLFLYDSPPRRLCGGWKMMINTKWLDKLGLKAPNDTEEFYNVLKAFRDGDPNGNGKPDEIPMLLKKNMITRFSAAWGVTTDYYIKQGTKDVVAGYAQPEFKEALKYFKRLYAEKLIDQELFTMTTAQYKAKAGSPDPVYGVDIDHMPGINMGKNAPEYQYMLPISLPGGKRQWYHQSSASIDVSKLSITKTNKYPRESMRLVDYFYSVEGSMSVDRGLKGLSWDFNKDGVPALNPTPAGMSYVEFKDKYRLDGMPSVLFTPGREYIQDPSLIAEDEYSKKNYDPYGINDYLPTLIYTNEDSEIIADLGVTIEGYKDEMIAKFIVGELDIDKNWDNYISTLKSMGLDKLIKIKDDRYKLYLKN